VICDGIRAGGENLMPTWPFPDAAESLIKALLALDSLNLRSAASNDLHAIMGKFHDNLVLEKFQNPGFSEEVRSRPVRPYLEKVMRKAGIMADMQRCSMVLAFANIALELHQIFQRFCHSLTDRAAAEFLRMALDFVENDGLLRGFIWAQQLVWECDFDTLLPVYMRAPLVFLIKGLSLVLGDLSPTLLSEKQEFVQSV
jgi:hypothetical protein